MHVVIMAGGVGTRLWPLSRQARPKQFQPLVSERSLLQETFDRVRQVAEPETIFVSTTDALVGLCAEQLPELPAANILIEPTGRNTGPALGLVAAVFERLDPETVVASVASDHVIGRPDRFAAALRLAGETVARRPELLLTIGLQPTWGNPGFGYIKAARQPAAGATDGLAVLPVERFEEKPEPATAEAYVAAGDYYWNGSYFIFRAGTMVDCIRRYDGALAAGLARIQAAWGAPDQARVLGEVYPTFASQPIDKLVFEPESAAGRVAVIPAALDWDDLGSWRTLLDNLQARTGATVVTRGEVIALDTARTLVYGQPGKLVATIGVDGLVVVDTPDALLVCAADRADEVKAVLERLALEDPRR